MEVQGPYNAAGPRAERLLSRQSCFDQQAGFRCCLAECWLQMSPACMTRIARQKELVDWVVETEDCSHRLLRRLRGCHCVDRNKSWRIGVTLVHRTTEPFRGWGLTSHRRRRQHSEVETYSDWHCFVPSSSLQSYPASPQKQLELVSSLEFFCQPSDFPKWLVEDNLHRKHSFLHKPCKPVLLRRISSFAFDK